MRSSRLRTAAAAHRHRRAAARKNKMADAMDVDASQPRQFRLVKASGDAHVARLPPSLGARRSDTQPSGTQATLPATWSGLRFA